MTRGRRRFTWWAVFLGGFLAIAAYISFDVLDLDGSELGNTHSDVVVIAEPGQAMEERLLSEQAPMSVQAARFLDLGSTTELQAAVRPHDPGALASRSVRHRPRTHPPRESRSAPPADPA